MPPATAVDTAAIAERQSAATKEILYDIALSMKITETKWHDLYHNLFFL